MGCSVLSNRIGKPFGFVSGAKIHHSVQVAGLLKKVPDTQALVLDFGKDETGLAYVQLWRRNLKQKERVGEGRFWALDALEQKLPDDFIALAKQLGFTSASTMYNLIKQKAKEGRIKTT